METVELERFLTDIESDRVERKASISEKDKIRQAICAFANDLPNHQQPGVIFIGANDDGSCAGLQVTDQLLLTLADMRSDGNILPFPAIIVEKRTLRGCELAVAIVEPSYTPPVRYKGRVWIRVGPRRAIASAEEELRLAEKRKARDVPFDVQPVYQASNNDLNTDFFRNVYLISTVSPEILEDNQRSLDQQLAALRFISTRPTNLPTVLGILTLGNNPLQYIPGAYIQFARFDGPDLSDPIKDEKAITGILSDQLRQLDELLHINITRHMDITGDIAAVNPDYPLPALQQITRNAVMHRTYEGTNAPVRIYWFSDRIEIMSPGGSFGNVTPENFGRPGLTDYRNPHLAEVMKNLGYVQKFGIGLQMTAQALERNGNPTPEFTVGETYIQVTLRPRS